MQVAEAVVQAMEQVAQVVLGVVVQVVQVLEAHRKMVFLAQPIEVVVEVVAHGTALAGLVVQA
jgi:hypothetical protein